MRKIKKGVEPQSLTSFKRAHPSARYKDASLEVRLDIRQACVEEQFYLCAYCCKAITSDNKKSVNEHIVPRESAHNLELDFNNLVASCTTKGQCDNAHGRQLLPLTPLMDECEHDLVFKLSGRVEGKTEAARTTIAVLNLGDSEQNNKAIVEVRKQLINTLLFTHGVDPADPVEDDELLQMVLDEILQPDDFGKLLAYAPVVANTLREWMALAS